MTRKDIPIVKEVLLKKQKNICPICGRDIMTLVPKNRCLDHDHETWMVRAVLCRKCNSLEGKIRNAFIRVGARNAGIDYQVFLKGLAKYYKIKPTKYIYPLKKKKKTKKYIKKIKTQNKKR